jgi:hypothetical protein
MSLHVYDMNQIQQELDMAEAEWASQQDEYKNQVSQAEKEHKANEVVIRKKIEEENRKYSEMKEDLESIHNAARDEALKEINRLKGILNRGKPPVNPAPHNPIIGINPAPYNPFIGVNPAPYRPPAPVHPIGGVPTMQYGEDIHPYEPPRPVKPVHRSPSPAADVFFDDCHAEAEDDDGPRIHDRMSVKK